MSFIRIETFTPTVTDPGQDIGTSKFGAKHAIQAIGTDYVHSELHGGRLFSYNEAFTLGAAGTKEILFQAPATGTAHLLITVSATGELTTDLYEGGTGAVGAEETAVFNRNRLSNIAPKSKIFQVGARVGGTLIETDSSGNGNKTAGISRGENEWILGDSEIYRLLITSGIASNDLAAKFEWYEPDEVY
jgi:hypothetical protein